MILALSPADMGEASVPEEDEEIDMSFLPPFAHGTENEELYVHNAVSTRRAMYVMATCVKAPRPGLQIGLALTRNIIYALYRNWRKSWSAQTSTWTRMWIASTSWKST